MFAVTLAAYSSVSEWALTLLMNLSAAPDCRRTPGRRSSGSDFHNRHNLAGHFAHNLKSQQGMLSVKQVHLNGARVQKCQQARQTWLCLSVVALIASVPLPV